MLKATELKSTGGETLSVENDGSIFVSGPNPNRAVYTLTLGTDLPAVTAIRLETVPDARLPDGGAGRYGNGNFHVSEFTAAIVSGSEGGKPTPIDISWAIADWQFGENETPTDMIDGNPLTLWETFPQIQKAHRAVFGLKSPARIDGGSMSITLDSGITEWGKHGLGRFRLSVTNEADAFVRAAVRMDFKDSEIADLNVALAKAYHLLGDQAALDSLLKAHPEAVAGIGDLYAAEDNWSRAITEYTKLITPEAKDPNLLAKRAEAYEKLKQWDLAVADWTRASRQQPDVAFQRFKPASTLPWRIELHNGAACSMEPVDGTLVFTTTVATGTNWHVQAHQAPLRLENGTEYVIRFKMKSPDSCSVALYGSIWQADWHSIGLDQTFVPPSEFKDYEFTFVAHDVIPGNNRIGFQFGVNRGKVMVREIVILKKLDAAALQATRSGLVAEAKAQQPEQTKSAFDEFLEAKRWKEAGEIGLQLVKQKPGDSLVWLSVAPVLVLAEDQAAYSGFCGRMAQQFAESKDPDVAERVVKVSLLRANSIDLAKVPGDRLARSLEEGTGPDWFPPWGWATRALLAYRKGDAEAALEYVRKSEELKPAEFAHAMNLAVLAMAQHRLKHPEESRRALLEVSQVIKRLRADAQNNGEHDLLIAEILFREAETVIQGNTKPYARECQHEAASRYRTAGVPIATGFLAGLAGIAHGPTASSEVGSVPRQRPRGRDGVEGGRDSGMPPPGAQSWGILRREAGGASRRDPSVGHDRVRQVIL